MLSLLSFGQSDMFDSTEYIMGLPVTNDDTVSSAFPDNPPRDVLEKLSTQNIPRKLLKELDRNDLFQGWSKRGVYRDVNTGLYMIYIRERRSTRVYGLDANGNPVTFDEMKTRTDSIE